MKVKKFEDKGSFKRFYLKGTIPLISVKGTAPFGHYPDKVEEKNSKYRMHRLWELLNSERGRITPQKAFMFLSDHTHYPRGLCRHMIGSDLNKCTTAAVVAEPIHGKLHVVRGNPCCNWPVMYTI